MCESCLRPSLWDSAKPLPRSLPLTPCTGESDCPSKEEERYLYYYFPDIASHYRRTLEKKEKEKEQKDKSKKKVVKAQQQKKDTKEEEEKKRKKERSKNRKRKKDKKDTCNRETKAKGKNQDKDKKAAQNDSFSSSSLSSDKDETTDNDNDDNDDVDSNQKKMACAFHQCYICYHERWESPPSRRRIPRRTLPFPGLRRHQQQEFVRRNADETTWLMCVTRDLV
ncbi:hypothetical protein VTO42DRAFT_3120 [Malbranchea cinnamomea]